MTQCCDKEDEGDKGWAEEGSKGESEGQEEEERERGRAEWRGEKQRGEEV